MRKRRLFAVLMSLALVFTYMPALAFAEISEAVTDPEDGATVYINPEFGDYYELSVSVVTDSDGYSVAWYYNDELQEGIEDSTFIADQPGKYSCVITDNAGDKRGYDFYAEQASLEFQPVANKKAWSYDSLFQDGDKLTVKLGKAPKVYTYTSGEWVCGDEKLDEYDVYAEAEFPDEFGQSINYSVEYSGLSAGPFSAEYVSEINSVSYSKSNISVWGPDIWGDHHDAEGNVTEGYILDAMNVVKDGEDEYCSAFAVGDAITVKYNSGKTVKYVYKVFREDGYLTGRFIDANDTSDEPNYIYAEYVYAPGSLKAGNNVVQLWVDEAAYTTVNIFIDTPEQRAQEDAEAKAKAQAEAAAKAQAAAAAKAKAAEAARQGKLNAKLPKVTASKPKAAKKAITVKWKKLNKKNQKKAQKIEIWICPNKKFAASDTIIKTASKSKSSLKIKKLKAKKKYYIKVRTIKTINGVKNVSKWSKVKSIKTK